MTDQLVLTAENVRRVLDLETHLPSGRATLFYEVLREELLSTGVARELGPTDGEAGSFYARLGRSSVIIRGGLPSKDDLVLLAALVGWERPTASIIAGSVLTLWRRLRKLNIARGELSVVEELYSGAKRPHEIHALLLGRPCPYPGKQCDHLESDNTCGISEEAVVRILQSLDGEAVRTDGRRWFSK